LEGSGRCTSLERLRQRRNITAFVASGRATNLRVKITDQGCSAFNFDVLSAEEKRILIFTHQRVTKESCGI
jgi:hypothetical protein